MYLTVIRDNFGIIHWPFCPSIDSTTEQKALHFYLIHGGNGHMNTERIYGFEFP
jgi:hypothetical protein